MAEDSVVEVEVVEEKVAHEPTPIEQEAQQLGWKPKEEFDGDEGKWVDAGEFIRRQELFDKIGSQSKLIKNLQKDFEALKIHYSKVKETEYKNALDTLRAQKKEALEVGDADRVVAIDDEILEVREAEKAAKAAPASAPVDPRFESWVNRNQWYTKDAELREYADIVGTIRAKRGGDPDEVMKYVEKEVRARFPDKFKNPLKEQPNLVEGGGRPPRKAVDSFELTEEETAVMKRLIRTIPGMTKEKYIEDLKKVR